jgi:hypothetical protein
MSDKRVEDMTHEELLVHSATATSPLVKELVKGTVVTDVNPETHEATVESKGAEDTVSVEVGSIFTARLKAPQPKPGWREYKKSEEPFIKSVRSLLDHMRSEPKHAALLVLLNDCEREYRNLMGRP